MKMKSVLSFAYFHLFPHSYSKNISSKVLLSRDLICWLLILLQVVVGTWSEITAIVPNPGVLGAPAKFVCFWDECNNTESIQWWFRNNLIYSYYSYNPDETFLEPANQVIPGVDMDLQSSYAGVMVLRKLTPESEGEYRCIITTLGFMSDTFEYSANLSVIDISYPPEINFENKKYGVGDTLEVTCVAKYPTPNFVLDFGVNGRIVNPELGLVTNMKNVSRISPRLYTTTSQLTLQLSQFRPGLLNVTCEAHVLSLKLENTVEILVGPLPCDGGVTRSSISIMVLTSALMLLLICYP